LRQALDNDFEIRGLMLRSRACCFEVMAMEGLVQGRKFALAVNNYSWTPVGTASGAAHLTPQSKEISLSLEFGERRLTPIHLGLHA
jgi:hypothetical protein